MTSKLLLAGPALFLLQGNAPAPLAPALPANALELPPAWPRAGAQLLFENDRGAMWNVKFAKGVGSGWHRHAYEFIGVELTTAAFTMGNPNGSSGVYAVARGQMWVLPKGLTHMEEGLTTPGRNILVVDRKEGPSPVYRNTSGLPADFAGTNAKLINDTARVLQWDVMLSPAAPEQQRFYSRDAFLGCIDGGKLRIVEAGEPPRVLDLKSGEGLFLKGGRARKLESVEGNVRVMLVELK